MCALTGAQNYKIVLVREGNCNLTRTQAATELVNWLATEPTGVDDLHVLIIGDLNSYALAYADQKCRLHRFNCRAKECGLNKTYKLCI